MLAGAKNNNNNNDNWDNVYGAVIMTQVTARVHLAQRHEQVANSCYMKMGQLGVEPASSQLQVEHPNHYSTMPHRSLTTKYEIKSKLSDQFDITVNLLIHWVNDDSIPCCSVRQQVSVGERAIIQQLLIKTTQRIIRQEINNQ